MNLKRAILLCVCLIVGVGVAVLQAMAIGAAAPSPGGLMPDRFVLVDDGSRRWVAVDSSGLGIRQYDMTPDPPQFFLDNNPVEEGGVPGWVLLPRADRSSISRGFGWPLVALSGTEVYEGRRMVETPGYMVTRRQHRLVPVSPRAGLAVNGLLFGLVVFGVVWVVGKVFGLLRKGERTPSAAGS